MKKKKVEISDILKLHIGDYKEKYGMSNEQHKVVYDILSCRTSYLGGHIEKCNHCGEERKSYNSCCNRHCPKCQCIAKEKWLEQRKSEILPVEYFHAVFTVPHDLNFLILYNKAILLKILFRSVSETLLQFGLNPKNKLGGKLGIIAFLHTWDQKLNPHFHLHCLIPGGVITEDGKRWIPSKKNYLFPEKALSIVFKMKFIDYLKEVFHLNQLEFPNSVKKVETAKSFDILIKKILSKGWVVDIQESIDKPEYVLEYVGRYTHRVAISNDRIKSLKDGEVTFTFKNRENGEIEEERISAVEFIKRFLFHVLPKRFMRVRYFGFLANRCKKKYIQKCRELLGEILKDQIIEKSIQEIMYKLTGKDILLCTKCKVGKFEVVWKIPKWSGINPYDIIHSPKLKDYG